MVNSTFWKNKTVLVTGCTGFKGAWLCLWLSAMGARVVGTARGTGSPNGVFAAANLAEKITLERADIRDESRILEIFAAHKPQVVFHLAAQPLVGLSYECPDETYAINVIGTLNVLAGIRATAECRCGIFVTTDRCAQQAANGQSRPNELLGGFDPYSNSKAASEILIATYRSTFLLPQGKGIAMGRSGNVVGGGDWAKDRLIPDCIRAMQARPLPSATPMQPSRGSMCWIFWRAICALAKSCGSSRRRSVRHGISARRTNPCLRWGIWCRCCAMPTTRTITTFATASRPGTGWSRCSGTKAPRAPCWTGARWFRLSTQWPMQPAGIRPPQSRTLPPKPWHSCRNTGKCASRPENAAAHSIRF